MTRLTIVAGFVMAGCVCSCSSVNYVTASEAVGGSSPAPLAGFTRGGAGGCDETDPEPVTANAGAGGHVGGAAGSAGAVSVAVVGHDGGHGGVDSGGAGGVAPVALVECEPGADVIDGLCFCPPGTVSSYPGCVSHCDAAQCSGTQYRHDLEPGESLWLSRGEVGCHEVVGYRPAVEGLMIPYYGDATKLASPQWTRPDGLSTWAPNGDVSHGFCLKHLSPSDLVIAGDGCERVGLVWCCSGTCTPQL